MSGRIEAHVSLEQFFEELLKEALRAEKLALDSASQAYLTHLLAQFAHHEMLHGQLTRDEPGTPALVWLYERAQKGSAGERFEAYRHMGDVALLVSGVFAPHVERDKSLVSIEYYVSMGAAAYDQAAALGRRTGVSELLAELAAKFRRLVEVLTRVAEKTTLPVMQDVGALYARLLRNPESASLAQRMMGRGVMPMLTPVKVFA